MASLFEPAEASQSIRAAPRQDAEYNRAEVHDFYETGLWAGPLSFNTSDVVVAIPDPQTPHIQAVYVGAAPDYVQLVVELETGVIVVDAPPHRSNVIIEWVRENIGKDILYIVPSHHHHDHAYGVADYAAAGATIVVPAIVGEYYRGVNGGNASILVYDEDHPFAVADTNVQFRAIWHQDAPHAKDWSYALATKNCPDEETKAVLHVADVYVPSPSEDRSTSWGTSGGG